MFFETTLTRQRIEAMTDAGHWTDELLIDRFRHHVARKGDAPLVTDRLGTLSWSQAAEQVDAFSKGLLALGVVTGDVVQLQLPNRREFVLAVLAVEQIGAVINPVAPIFRSNEVSVMSELARPVVVVTVSEFRNFGLADMHLELRGRCPWVKHVVVVPARGAAGDGAETGPGDGIPADCMSWDEVLERGRASGFNERTMALLRPSPNDVCEVMFTSGTTGQPKGVMHTQNTINAAADLWLERIAPDCTTFHMSSTLAHQTGYLYGIRAPISAGAQIVYQEVWNATEFAGLIERHRIDASMGATPFLADLLAVENLDQFDLSSFKAFVCAGAAIPLPVLERARDLLPCTVMPGWGMTETALSTTGRRDDPFDKRATDGSALAGNEVRVVDESGDPVGVGIEGDLQFRGSLAFVGYIQGRELTESCWRDGWFDTGDRAVMDSDGYISISGRTKDIVIRGGENVPVKEVEDVLLRHPAVANVAVIAQPHERLGEIGCAVIVAVGAPPTLADLTAFLAEQKVTPQFWPEALQVVEEFPMTPSGKIQKYRLRQLVESGDV
ncbi:MAG: AMP-binding protein [Actinomycetota bacterium]|nr:AMP-binding protein [Actinomycetota bacterium]